MRDNTANSRPSSQAKAAQLGLEIIEVAAAAQNYEREFLTEGVP